MDGTENPSLISQGGILAGLYSSTGERKTRFGRSAADLCQTCMIFRDFFAHFSHFSKEDFSVNLPLTQKLRPFWIEKHLHIIPQMRYNINKKEVL